MEQFKVGDKVKCIDVNNYYDFYGVKFLKLNEFYTIKYVGKTTIIVEEIEDYTFCIDRFEPNIKTIRKIKIKTIYGRLLV